MGLLFKGCGFTGIGMMRETQFGALGTSAGGPFFVVFEEWVAFLSASRPDFRRTGSNQSNRLTRNRNEFKNPTLSKTERVGHPQGPSRPSEAGMPRSFHAGVRSRQLENYEREGHPPDRSLFGRLAGMGLNGLKYLLFPSSASATSLGGRKPQLSSLSLPYIQN